ncbi:hypothetical protein OAN22_00110 [Alphaproteobacteria bacterium]|nr:hypothetical protein [Alphaproteobacteria bacterium]
MSLKHILLIFYIMGCVVSSNGATPPDGDTAAKNYSPALLEDLAGPARFHQCFDHRQNKILPPPSVPECFLLGLMYTDPNFLGSLRWPWPK